MVHFTHQERWVVVFLVGALVLNLGIRWYKSLTSQNDILAIHTAREDSLFLARVKLVDSLARMSTIEDTIPAQIRELVAERDAFRVSINTADEDLLQQLPGIGPVMAKRIIAHREKNGYFTSLKSLENVHGIGPITANKLKDYINLEKKE